MAIALILGICFASCGNTWVCVVAIVAVVMVAISFYRKGHKLQFFLQSAMLFGCFILGNQRFSTDMQLREKVSSVPLHLRAVDQPVEVSAAAAQGLDGKHPQLVADIGCK